MANDQNNGAYREIKPGSSSQVSADCLSSVKHSKIATKNLGNLQNMIINIEWT